MAKKKKAKKTTKKTDGKNEKGKIVFIVDRSGSMCSIASDMQGAIKNVLDTQKKEYKGEMLVTLVRFDDDYEEVFFDKPLAEVDDIKISPRGCTALIDAMGKTINRVERNFTETPKKDRPSKVLFIIITDGEENASREFSRDKVFEMIEKAKRDYEWDFTFIGANQDSISEAATVGIRADKTISYAATASGVRGMSKAVSNYTDGYFKTGKASYDDKDRKDAMKDND